MGATTEHTDVLAFAPGRRRGPARRQRDVREQQPGAPHGHLRRPAARCPRTRATRRVGGSHRPVTAHADGHGGPFNSGLLPPAAPPNAPPPEAARSFTFVIPEAGDYPYVCILHAPSGMAGTIKVA